MRLIDADRLLTEKMKSVYYHLPNGDIAIPIIDIEHAPTVEPKQGKWIEVESYESEKYSVTDMKCNLCGKYSQMVLPHQTKCIYHYCPFCGAKMKGVDDEYV